MYAGTIDNFTYIAQNFTLHKHGQDWMGTGDFIPPVNHLTFAG